MDSSLRLPWLLKSNINVEILWLNTTKPISQYKLFMTTAMQIIIIMQTSKRTFTNWHLLNESDRRLNCLYLKSEKAEMLGYAINEYFTAFSKIPVVRMYVVPDFKTRNTLLSFTIISLIWWPYLTKKLTLDRISNGFTVATKSSYSSSPSSSSLKKKGKNAFFFATLKFTSSKMERG